MKWRKMEENTRMLIKLATAMFNLLLDVARPSSEKPYNCFSEQFLGGEKGNKSIYALLLPLVKFSSRSGCYLIAFPGCNCLGA